MALVLAHVSPSFALTSLTLCLTGLNSVNMEGIRVQIEKCDYQRRHMELLIFLKMLLLLCIMYYLHVWAYTGCLKKA